jgi:hypothetical protein
MKKIVIAIAVFLNCSFMIAQTEFDAFKMVQTDINGTARYMSMGGAFGALGGDASAIKDNPAGLGIYRSSELVGTLNLLSQNSTANWNSSNGLSDLYKTGFNNFSLVIASPTWRNESQTSGLMSSNLSFAYNRLKTFNRSLNIKSGTASSSMTDYMSYFTGNISGYDLDYVENEYEPFDNTSVPWLSVLAYEGWLMDESISGTTSSWSSILGDTETVTPGYKLYEKGYVDEYSFGWAGNFSNIFYLGATVNLHKLNYTANSEYSENFGEGGYMNLKNDIYVKGSGLNLKLGTIISPLDFLRIGLSVQTPTVYTLNDIYDAELSYDTNITGSINTPGGSSEYQIQGPMQINVSGAFLLGKKGLISAEYNYNNYSGTRLRNELGDASSFSDENEGMSAMLNDVRTIKIGGEFRLSENFSLRAGYANSNNGNKIDAAKLIRYNTVRTDTEYFLNNRTDYLTAGFGFHESNWFIDFAFMNKILDETFYPYNSNNLAIAVAPAKVITTNNNMIVTLGFKF